MAEIKNAVLDKIILIYSVLFFIQPERIISYYVPSLKYLNGVPTPIFYLMIASFFVYAKTEKVYKSPLFKLICAFVFFLALSSVFAKNTGKARLILWPMVDYLFYLYILTYFYVNSKEKLIQIVNLYILSSFIFGILGFFNGAKLPFIPELNDEDALGPFAAMLMPFSLFLGMARGSRKMKCFYFLTVIICIGAVIHSNARGAFISLVVGFLYYFFKSDNKGKILIKVLLVTTFSLTFFHEEIIESEFAQEVTSIFSERERIEQGEGTGASRLFLWKMGLLMFAESPLIGIGPINFGVHLPDHVENNQDEQVGLAYYGQIVHNDYLEILIGTGLFGFIIFFVLMFKVFRLNRKNRELSQEKLVGKQTSSFVDWEQALYLSYAIEASLIVLMVNMFFYGIIYYKKFYWAVLLLLLASHKLLHQDD